MGIATLAVILSVTSIVLAWGKSSAVMTSVSSISTATAAVVGVFVLLVALGSLRTSQGMLDEMRKQREATERPIISVATVLETRKPGILNLRIANTGRGPAYDLKVSFAPDIPWGQTSLNQAGVLSHLPVVNGGDKIEFFLAAGGQLEDAAYPPKSQASVTYFCSSVDDEFRMPLQVSFPVLLSAWRGSLQIRLKDVHELVEEVEDLKHALLIDLEDRQRGTQSDREDR